MPGRLQQTTLRNSIAGNVRLGGSLLVIAIISLIVVGGVIMVRAPLAGWAA